MQYVSKGAVSPGSASKKLTVNLRGAENPLLEEESALWLDGQFEVCELPEACPACEGNNLVPPLKRLNEMGLVETTDEIGAIGKYRLLTGCIIVPVKQKLLRQPLTAAELLLWQWISKAGLRLTIAEMICLAEKGVIPKPELLGAENRQALVETIYSADTIADTVLESLMKKAQTRDATVEAALSLLRKKRILLL
jgi:hypothetical protein